MLPANTVRPTQLLIHERHCSNKCSWRPQRMLPARVLVQGSIIGRRKLPSANLATDDWLGWLFIVIVMYCALSFFIVTIVLCCLLHSYKKSQFKTSWIHFQCWKHINRNWTVTNGSNDDPNNTIQLLNLYEGQIMKESRISVAQVRTFFWQFLAKFVVLHTIHYTIMMLPSQQEFQLVFTLFSMLKFSVFSFYSAICERI